MITFVKVQWHEYDCTLTVNHRSLIDRLFGWPGYNRAWRGDCTVWHDAGSGRRAGTDTEAALCNIWTKARWDKGKSA